MEPSFEAMAAQFPYEPKHGRSIAEGLKSIFFNEMPPKYKEEYNFAKKNGGWRPPTPVLLSSKEWKTNPTLLKGPQLSLIDRQHYSPRFYGVLPSGFEVIDSKPNEFFEKANFEVVMNKEFSVFTTVIEKFHSWAVALDWFVKNGYLKIVFRLKEMHAALQDTCPFVPEDICCRICRTTDLEQDYIFCNHCDDPYHKLCLNPPLHDYPKQGHWFCPVCSQHESTRQKRPCHTAEHTDDEFRRRLSDYDTINTSNISDFCGLLNSFLYCLNNLTPVKYYPDAHFRTGCLYNTSIFPDADHYYWHHLHVTDVRLFPKLFGVKLVTGHYYYSIYQVWAPVELPLPFETLLKHTDLKDYLVDLFLYMMIPPVMLESPMRQDAPYTMKSFVLLISRLYEIGYPAHWLADIIRDMMNGSIAASIYPTKYRVEKPPDRKLPKATIDLTPFTQDLKMNLVLAYNSSRIYFGLPAVKPMEIGCYRAAISMDRLENDNVMAVSSILVWCNTRWYYQPSRSLARHEIREDFLKESRKHGIQVFTSVGATVNTDPLCIRTYLPKSLVTKENSFWSLYRCDQYKVIATGIHLEEMEF